MKIAQFQVSSRHTKTPNRLRVMIYDNLDEVRKLGGKWNGGEPFSKKTYGVTNKQALYGNGDKPILLDAIIRVEKDHCATGLIAHEVCHAAIYFFTEDGHRLHKNSPISKEEKFCYLYGDLFHEVTKKMYDKGIWS